MKAALQDQTLSDQENGELRSFRRVQGLFFYYIADKNGKLIFREEPYERKQSELLTKISNWKPSTYETRSVSVSLDFSELENNNTTINPDLKERNDHDADNEARIEAPLLTNQTDRSNFHLIISAKPIYSKNKLIGMLYMGKDITSSFDLFYKLLKALVLLGIVFIGIVFPLSYIMSRRAMKPIRESYTRQREFVADASHELRTPLSILHSSLDVVEEEEKDKLTPFSKRIVGDMRDELRRMTKLVTDLLTLARADSGQPLLTLSKYDLIPSLQKVIRNAQTLAQAKQIQIQLDSPPSLKMSGDVERIEQLMYILLENAVKYTPNEGHIAIAVQEDIYARPAAVEIKVTDSGIGIPATDLPHVFDRFYRVDKHRAKQLGGTGLGLSIAKWIVQAHAGSIRVESEGAVGTTFIVSIPIES
jgi:signal transduction histidine kinase